MTGLEASGLTNLLALVGAVVLLLGITGIATGAVLGGSVMGVLGVILIWWAWAERRKSRVDLPESEADGSHTIE